MKIVEWKDKSSWNQFVAGNSSPASFLQGWEWGEFQCSQGNKVLRLGFVPAQTRERETGELLATVSLIKRCLPLPGMCFWFCPRGPVIKKDNLGSQAIIIQQLIGELAETKQIFLRVTPYWPAKLNKTRWLELGLTKPQLLLSQQQPQLTWLTKLAEPDNLLQSMHQKTRYNIRLAERKGVKFKFYEISQDLETAWELLKNTAEREKIRIYKKDYYTVLMMVTRLITKPNAQVAKTELRSILGLARYQGRVLATGLWLAFGNSLTYLHGGSSRAHKEVMAPYLLHWQMLQWGYKKGYELYDWWGIEKEIKARPRRAEGEAGDERLKLQDKGLAGVTRFKKGFGEKELEFAGTYDYVYNKRIYKSLSLLKKMKEIF